MFSNFILRSRIKIDFRKSKSMTPKISAVLKKRSKLSISSMPEINSLMDQATNWTTPIHQPDHIGLS